MSDFTPGGGGGPGDADLEDLLSQMFGGFPGMQGMPGGRGPGKKKGKDVVQQYEVSLEELYKGKTVKLASTRNVLCTVCKG
jgi:DnaJ family protein A protein 2